MNNYEIILYWDKTDNCFIAEIPELSGCIAHGKIEFDSLENVRQAKDLWLAMAREFGDPVPEPKGRLVYA